MYAHIKAITQVHAHDEKTPLLLRKMKIIRIDGEPIQLIAQYRSNELGRILMSEHEDEIRLLDIFVSLEYRFHGIGIYLMKHFLTSAKSKDAIIVIKNSVNHPFYENLGFYPMASDLRWHGPSEEDEHYTNMWGSGIDLIASDINNTLRLIDEKLNKYKIR